MTALHFRFIEWVVASFLSLIGYFHRASFCLSLLKCGFLLSVSSPWLIIDPEGNPPRGGTLWWKERFHIWPVALDSCLVCCSLYLCEYLFPSSVRLLGFRSGCDVYSNRLRHVSVQTDLDELFVPDMSNCWTVRGLWSCKAAVRSYL